MNPTLETINAHITQNDRNAEHGETIAEAAATLCALLDVDDLPATPRAAAALVATVPCLAAQIAGLTAALRATTAFLAAESGAIIVDGEGPYAVQMYGDTADHEKVQRWWLAHARKALASVAGATTPTA